MESYLSILKLEYENRLRLNQSYSLNAFARDLSISPPHLNSILKGEKGLSPEKAEIIAEKLGLSESESKRFVLIVASQHGRSKVIRHLAKGQLDQMGKRKLDMAQFLVVADWTRYGLWTAMQLNKFDGSAEWLSDYFGLELEVVKEALADLIEVGMVKKKRQKYFALFDQIDIRCEFPQLALRQSHKQSLKSAIDSLDNTSRELRDITSTTLAIDIDKIPEAKKRIEQFRREMTDFLESGQKKEVYNLNIQLHPLITHKENENE